LGAPALDQRRILDRGFDPHRRGGFAGAGQGRGPAGAVTRRVRRDARGTSLTLGASRLDLGPLFAAQAREERERRTVGAVVPVTVNAP
jgi:hypothetical protein